MLQYNVSERSDVPELGEMLVPSVEWLFGAQI
jgi:hypothetical protein